MEEETAIPLPAPSSPSLAHQRQQFAKGFLDPYIATENQTWTAEYILKLAGPELVKDAAGIMKAMQARSGAVKIGTACSGTDCAVSALFTVAKMLRGIEMQHLFCCEIDESKRQCPWISLQR